MYVYFFLKCVKVWSENSVGFENSYGNWLPDGLNSVRGARWLSGRLSDSGARGRGFETYLRRVVSLSKTLYSLKVLVNYPGSSGSVPTWQKKLLTGTLSLNTNKSILWDFVSQCEIRHVKVLWLLPWKHKHLLSFYKYRASGASEKKKQHFVSFSPKSRVNR